MKSKKNKKSSFKTILFSDLLMLICVCMLLYPITADIWNAKHTSRMYGAYKEAVDNLDDEEYAEILNQAKSYNETLINRGNSRFNMTDDERAEYESCLNIPDTDVMAYITCDKIGVKHMPIYHGTGDAVLQAGIGHYEGSSLPVGGESTHCVLSGHTGMAGLKMFSELTKLKKGDSFRINVLNKTLTYQVDDINEVYPNDISHLEIEEGKDYCTLITCIPVGLNSKRLLVRGIRVGNQKKITLVEEKKQNIFGQIWKWLMARFAVYELVMAAVAALIVVIFIIPDMRKIHKQLQNRKQERGQEL